MVNVRICNNENNFLDDMESVLGSRYTFATGWIRSAKDIRILNRENSPQTALHEFSHAVSLVVNHKIAYNTHWLWESVAIYEVGEFVVPETFSRSFKYPIRNLKKAGNFLLKKIY